MWNVLRKVTCVFSYTVSMYGCFCIVLVMCIYICMYVCMFIYIYIHHIYIFSVCYQINNTQSLERRPSWRTRSYLSYMTTVRPWWRHQLETFPRYWPFVRGIHRWIPLTKASDAEVWCFLWSAPEQTVEQTIETPVIWDAIALIMPLTVMAVIIPTFWLKKVHLLSTS